MYAEFVEAVKGILEPLLEGRLSAITTTALTYAVFTLIRAASSLVIDREKVARLESLVGMWEERRKKAIEARDLKMYERVMKEKARVERARRELEKERIKGTVVSIIAWLVIFKVLLDSVGAERPVALFPLPTGYVKLPFYAWFMVNSFWANALIARVWSVAKWIGRKG